VVDHGVQPREFMQKTATMLAGRFPDVDWSQRLTAITANAPWPFADGFFDMVLSNQVLEHVHEPERFMAEQFRVLARGGCGFHLFPLKHYVYEGHLLLPWVHRIRSWDLMRAYIELLSRLGLGKYREHRRATGVSLDEFATRHADYMFFWTRYMTERQAVEIARAAGFRACYRFTAEFYTGKLRSIFRRRRRTHYDATGRALRDVFAVKLLRYASCVTLTLEKQNAY
jgi:SAM-dependent methyltransferase